MIASTREPLVLLTATLAALAVSAIRPFDRLTWLLEVFPVLAVIPILLFTYRRFPLTPLLYRLIFLHALVLIVGGHYTYAKVPMGFWAQDWLELSRNHYDRFGHFMQGFVPAMVAREILLRVTALERGKMLFFIVTCISLAISAFYEMIEWWAAVGLGFSAEAFLATQGDVWDTQWDMFIALLGAIIAQWLLHKPHNRAVMRRIMNAA